MKHTTPLPGHLCYVRAGTVLVVELTTRLTKDFDTLFLQLPLFCRPLCIQIPCFIRESLFIVYFSGARVTLPNTRLALRQT
jgi:hypothetical protein